MKLPSIRDMTRKELNISSILFLLIIGICLWKVAVLFMDSASRHEIFTDVKTGLGWIVILVSMALQFLWDSLNSIIDWVKREIGLTNFLLFVIIWGLEDLKKVLVSIRDRDY